MSAIDTVEALLNLGVTVKDAYTKASASGKIDWVTFATGPDFEKVSKDVGGLLGKLSSGDVTAALKAVQAKEEALLAGQAVPALSSDKLTQYFALLSAEGLLVAQELRDAGKSAGFLQWLVNTALPTLAPIIKVIVPLLV